jgi:hypothetical protein
VGEVAASRKILCAREEMSLDDFEKCVMHRQYFRIPLTEERNFQIFIVEYCLGKFILMMMIIIITRNTHIQSVGKMHRFSIIKSRLSM